MTPAPVAYRNRTRATWDETRLTEVWADREAALKRQRRTEPRHCPSEHWRPEFVKPTPPAPAPPAQVVVQGLPVRPMVEAIRPPEPPPRAGARMTAGHAWDLLLDCLGEQPLFTTAELYPQFNALGYLGDRREFEQLRRRALNVLVTDGQIAERHRPAA